MSLTVWSICRININMEVFVSLQRLLEQLHFLVTFQPPRLRVRLALPIAFHLVEPHHLLDTIPVLLFNAQFEFELRKHQLDART